MVQEKVQGYLLKTWTNRQGDHQRVSDQMGEAHAVSGTEEGL